VEKEAQGKKKIQDQQQQRHLVTNTTVSAGRLEGGWKERHREEKNTG
jgi:hypothetical protein